jgi:hypothetical protein
VRFWFGGNATDYNAPDPTKGDLVVVGPPNLAGVTAWTTRTGKTQVTDLLPFPGDPAPVVLDGAGCPRAFQGPDGVDTLWLDYGDGSPRVQIRGRGRGDLPLLPPATDLASALALLNTLRAGLIRAGLATDA